MIYNNINFNNIQKYRHQKLGSGRDKSKDGRDDTEILRDVVNSELPEEETRIMGRGPGNDNRTLL